ncbi:MAG: hypothetical protein WA002_01615, partial [Candidatus Acidiferrales bacterium]
IEGSLSTRDLEEQIASTLLTLVDKLHPKKGPASIEPQNQMFADLDNRGPRLQLVMLSHSGKSDFVRENVQQHRLIA